MSDNRVMILKILMCILQFTVIKFDITIGTFQMLLNKNQDKLNEFELST